MRARYTASVAMPKLTIRRNESCRTASAASLDVPGRPHYNK